MIPHISSSGWMRWSSGAKRSDMTSRCEVPLAELENYQTRLGSLTGGVGSFTMAFSHYQPVPAPLQKEMSTSFEVADSA